MSPPTWLELSASVCWGSKPPQLDRATPEFQLGPYLYRLSARGSEFAGERATLEAGSPGLCPLREQLRDLIGAEVESVVLACRVAARAPG